MCDFKTGTIKSEHLAKYAMQLHAYTYMVENPAPGSLHVPKINVLGLAVFEPKAFSYDARDSASLSGAMRWIAMPREDERLLKFLDEVASVLEAPGPPDPSPMCDFCRYRIAA